MLMRLPGLSFECGQRVAWDFPLSQRELLCRLFIQDATAKLELEQQVESTVATLESAQMLVAELKGLHKRTENNINKEGCHITAAIDVGECLSECSIPHCTSCCVDRDDASQHTESMSQCRQSMVRNDDQVGSHKSASGTCDSQALRGQEAVVGTCDAQALRGLHEAADYTCDSQALRGLSEASGGMRYSLSLRGSISSILWCGDLNVEHVVLVGRSPGEFQSFGSSADPVRMSWNGTWIHSGSVILRRDEYIVEVRGQGGQLPNLASWLMITTSEGQHALIGNRQASNSAEPAFVFCARPGHEIISFVLDADGQIADSIQQNVLNADGESVQQRMPTHGAIARLGGA